MQTRQSDINAAQPSLPQGFALMDRLDHDELVPFVQEYIKRRPPSALFYLGFIAFSAGLIAFEMMRHRLEKQFNYPVAFSYLFFGFFGAIVLLPIHEGIHLLAYRLLGAKHTSRAANWRKFYFMALAHGFVSNRRQFQAVSTAPFICIGSVLIVLWLVLPVYWGLAGLGMLLIHMMLFGGDFGKLSYFDVHRDKDVLTWDDTVEKVSWFYGRPKKKT